MNPRRVTQHNLLPPNAKVAVASWLPRQHAFQCHFVPVSNIERQRQFRERNPGYYGRIKAEQRAATKARVKQKMAIDAILGAYRAMPLMLPAPVEPLEIPGMTTIPRRDEVPVPAMVEMRKAA